MNKGSRQNIIKGSVIMFTGKFTRIVALFLITSTIGNFLGARVLGLYSLSNSIFQFLALFSVFGLYQTINRFAPAYIKTKNGAKLRALTGTAIKYGLFSSILIATVVLALSEQIANFFSAPELVIYLRILILALPAFTLTRILLGISTSHENVNLESLIENIVNPVISLIGIVLVIVLTIPDRYVMSTLLTAHLFSLTAILIAKYFGKLKHLKLVPSFKKFDKEYLIYSRAVFLNTILFFLIKYLDTLMLGYFDTEKNVGIYNAALNVAIIPSIFLTSVNTIYYPTITRLFHEKKDKMVEKLYEDVVRLLTQITIPLSVFTVIYSKELLSLFGNEFEIPMVLMLILVLGTISNLASGPIGFTLNALDKQKLISINSIFSISSAVVLDIILIPKIGIIGAAIGNATAMFVQNSLGVIELYLIRKFTPYNMKIYSTFIVSLAYGLAFYLIQRNFNL
ncbi:oligosaccharide flippase family protein, partial [Candidatus Dojkabacteria bacterium]|nr:oligosaccharide flippase family protein [Candidatus Dojkabacteria bacterium]